MSAIRVLVPEPNAHREGIPGYLKSLQRAGHHILYVICNRPYEDMATRWERNGVPQDQMFFIDAVTSLGGNIPQERPENVMFLRSPTMLEMMAMRIEQWATRNVGQSTHVVLDNLNALALYNGAASIQEFSHYLVNRMRTHNVPTDLIILDNDEGRDLEERISAFVDGRHGGQA